MVSIKIKIKEDTNIKKYMQQYSHAFRMVYSNFDNFSKQLQDKILKKNDLLDVSIYKSIMNQVTMKKEIEKSSKKLKKSLIIRYTEELETETNKSRRFKLDDKRNKLIGSLEKEIVFGGKSNLQNYVRQLNKYNKTGNIENKLLAEKYLEKYRDQRIIPYYSIGDANLKGNRKFNFNLFENEVTFKPDRYNHILLKLFPNKNQRKQLVMLQNVLDTNPIPVTISLKENFIVLTYDNEKLAGFAFNKTEYKRAKKKNKIIESKMLARDYFEEQHERQLKNKNSNCVAAIDMNPEYIGLTIRNSKRILFTKCYDLSELLKITKGNDTKEIKYNLGNIYKQIFSICNHFKVAYFFCEKLKFEHNISISHSANRKNDVLWCRTFQTNSIKKYCQNLGIQNIELNAAYSSYVGNMMNNFFDPVAASVELARRGLVLLKKIGDKWYPEQTNFPLDNLQTLTNVGYVPTVNYWNLSEQNKFRSLSVRSGYKFISSRYKSGPKGPPLRYRRTTKYGYKSNFIKCKTFSGHLENENIGVIP